MLILIMKDKSTNKISDILPVVKTSWGYKTCLICKVLIKLCKESNYYSVVSKSITCVEKNQSCKYHLLNITYHS